MKNFFSVIILGTFALSLVACTPQTPPATSTLVAPQLAPASNTNETMIEKKDGAMMENTNEAPVDEGDGGVMEKKDEPAPPSVTQPVTIQVIAKQWEFIPSTIVVKKGQLVRLEIKSTDVSHGIAIPDFGVTSVLASGKTTVVEFTPDKTGSFSFFCSVFCGAKHTEMRGSLVVQE